MRALAVLVSALAVAATSTPARADDKAECSSAYAETQSLRRAGKLVDAHARVVLCMRDACAAFIRSDCVKWFGEIEAAQPTVVLDVKDARGNDASGVRVTLDGRPWIDGLDGKARALDPGPHTLRFEMAGARAVEQTLEAREGDKGRRVGVTFGAVDGEFTVARDRPSRSPAPWILGGVGVAALVAGGVMGGVVVGAKSTLDAHCHGSTCDSQDGVDAASTIHALGPATTIALVAGGAAVAGAAVWLAVRPSAASPSDVMLLTPWVGSSTGGLALQGSF
ncbi:MAG TPA: hypothetical protein VGM56_28125 [Byssovorax sp.]|jgi:hypothetical protein